MATNDTDKRDGLLRLVRRTADGLTDLVGQHLKLARLELAGDLLTAVKQIRVLAVLALLIIVGYTLTMAGLAVLLGDNHRLGVAFLTVGLVHVGVGGVGMLFAVIRARRGPRVMVVTAGEVSLSIAALAPAGPGMEKNLAV